MAGSIREQAQAALADADVARARRRRARPACGPATRSSPTCCAAGDGAGARRGQQDRRRSSDIPLAARVPRARASATRWPCPRRRASGTGDLLDALVERAARGRRRARGRRDDPPGGDRPPERRQVVAGQQVLRLRARHRLRRGGHDARRDRPARWRSTGAASIVVDTAGMRRQAKVTESVEYYTTLRSQRAVERADVALVVCDAPTASPPRTCASPSWR